MRVPRFERMMLVCFALVALLLAFAPAFPIVTDSASAAEPKIAVSWSQITYDATMPPIAADATAGTPPLVLGGKLYSDRVRGIEDLLRKEFGTSAVTRIGDAQLADVKSLRQYDVVVLTRQVAATGAMRSALRDYVAAGGSLVCSFGTGRWDYQPKRSQPYYWLVYLTGNNAWEWGEVSELMQASFVNDPPMISGFHVVDDTADQAAKHPILQRTLAELGRPSIDLRAKIADCPELVKLMPGASVTPLLLYDQATVQLPTGERLDPSGEVAAWVSEYHLGRVVYFGFQLHDLARGDGVHDGSYATADTQRQASRLLVNAVKWAAETERYGVVIKDPRLSLSGKVDAKGKVTVSQKVTNAGTAQLRGYMQIRFYDPADKLKYSASKQTSKMTMWPGATSAADWVIATPVKPAKGIWTARCSFSFWDYFRSGNALATREMYFRSDGTKLVPAGAAAQRATTGARASNDPVMSGANRYEVSAAAAGHGWPNGLSAPHAIVLASGAAPAEALAAAPLAGSLSAPLLLTARTGLDKSVAARITALARGASSVTVYVMGDRGSVGDPPVARATEAIRQAGVKGTVKTVRIMGADAAAIAAAVARRVGTPASGPFAKAAFIVHASAYADALSVAPIAVRNKVPILYVNSAAIPEATRQVLAELGITHTIIAGGPGTITTAVESELEEAGYREASAADNSLSPDTRIWGATRYDVSAQAVQYGVGYGAMNAAVIGIASGTAWADALSAGPMLGVANHPLELVNGADGNKSPAVLQELMTHRSASAPIFFGGSASVTPYVRGQVATILGR